MLTLKKKNSVIFSMDAGKAVDKLQHPFLIELLSRLGIEGDCLNLTKGNDSKPTRSVRPNDKRLNAFSLSPGARLFSSTLQTFVTLFPKYFTF